MNITIDTSVLLAVCTNEPSKPRMIELTMGHHLLAPASVHWEMGNALSAMLKRERITLEQAQACVASYQSIPLTKIEVDLATAVQLASRFRIYAYDAYLLTCALTERCPLLTLDRALIAVAKQLNLQVLGVET
jgi:predicted nucleic acid-binding protein